MKRSNPQFLRIFVIFAIVFYVGSANIYYCYASYMDSWNFEEKFFNTLLEADLTDFAQNQLELMRNQFPSKTEFLIFLTGRLHFEMGEREKALNNYSKIGSNSSLYPQACLEIARASQDENVVKSAYEKFFDIVESPPIDRKMRNDYNSALSSYLAILEKEGDSRSAKEFFNSRVYLSTNKDSMSRSQKLSLARTILRGVEIQKKNGKSKKKYKNNIEEALTILEALLWEQDLFASLAYSQIAYAYLLLDKPQKAISTIEDGKEFIKSIEGILTSPAGGHGPFPLAAAYYHWAEANLFLAKEQSSSDESRAEEFYTQCLKTYYQISRKYIESEYAPKAIEKIDHITEILESKYDRKITVPRREEQLSRLKIALSHYRNGNYDSAYSLAISSAKIDLDSEIAAKAFYLSAISARKSGLPLESTAICDLLFENFPNSKYASKAALHIASYLWKLANLKDKNQKERGTDNFTSQNSVRLFKQFLQNFPDHPKANRVALSLADTLYSSGVKAIQANEFKSNANPIPSDLSSGKDLLNAKFFYEFLIEHHPSEKDQNQVVFKIAWIHKLLNNHEDAVNYFLRFSESEPITEKDIYAARCYAADSLVRSKRFDEAIEILTKLVKQIGPSDEPTHNSDINQIYRDGLWLLAWTYGNKAEQIVKNNQTPIVINQIRHQAIASFSTYFATFPDDPTYTPLCLAQLGLLYSNLNNYQESINHLNLLLKRFPHSSVSKKSISDLGKTYFAASSWELATNTFRLLSSELQTLSDAKISFIANGLYQDNSLNFQLALAPDLVLSANKEILRRCGLKSSIPNQSRKDRRRERAQYMEANCYGVMNNFDEALKLYNNYLTEYGISSLPTNAKVSPYYFRVLLKKGILLYEANQYLLALESFNELLTYISPTNFSEMYCRTLLESGKAMMESTDKKQVRKSIARFLQIITFADPTDKNGETRIEEAHLRAMEACLVLGDLKQAQIFKEEYLTSYPDGLYRTEILKKGS